MSSYCDVLIQIFAFYVFNIVFLLMPLLVSFTNEFLSKVEKPNTKTNNFTILCLFWFGGAVWCGVWCCTMCAEVFSYFKYFSCFTFNLTSYTSYNMHIIIVSDTVCNICDLYDRVVVSFLSFCLYCLWCLLLNYIRTAHMPCVFVSAFSINIVTS